MPTFWWINSFDLIFLSLSYGGASTFVLSERTLTSNVFIFDDHIQFYHGLLQSKYNSVLLQCFSPPIETPHKVNIFLHPVWCHVMWPCDCLSLPALVFVHASCCHGILSGLQNKNSTSVFNSVRNICISTRTHLHSNSLKPRRDHGWG